MIGVWVPHDVSLCETVKGRSVHFNVCKFQLLRKELQSDPVFRGGRRVGGDIDGMAAFF